MTLAAARIGAPAALLLTLGLAGPAFAQETKELSGGDTAWMLVSTALVLMMTVPGVALFYSGMVRKKNVLATMMQSFAITALVTVIWMVIGYSLVFAEGGSLIGGFSKVLLMDMGVTSQTGTIPESVFMTFQMTFAIITCALITGALADRMKFSALMIFIALWLILVYAPIAHWVWGGGFLMTDGVLDYAGGTVVHINAGVAGLVGAIVLGKRKGFGTDNMAPFNLGLAVIGAALAWMVIEWIVRGKPSVLGIISGAVAGLVAITPASGFVLPGGALVIGLVAGLVCFWASTSLKRKFKYDDSLDVFGVHAVGGIVGAILTGVFAMSEVSGSEGPAGLIEGNAGQVLTQIYGIAVTIAYCAIVSFILFKIVGALVGLRVSEDEEREGLDLALHGESLH